uniref:UBX domain-containing protein 11 isoform X3 n=1 Tax=Doryrhamphus excisus TaxID=161450 RepID=UPI0025ADF887|nr:UBX domain-containing protein 11 isoform X3 [Doryrhamphus excisus]
MSSPLSMLKKNRRSPLESENTRPGQKQVQFRETASPDISISELPVSDNPSLPGGGDVNSTICEAPKKGVPPSDLMLMSVMMQRLTLLERKVRSQKEEMGHKDQLKAQEMSEGCSKLERRCQQLQHQVDEMESFLNDYGLIWVGDRKHRDAAVQTSSITGTIILYYNCNFPLKYKVYLLTDTSGLRHFHMDFDLLLQRIKELNILAGEGESFVQSTPSGAQLARKVPVQLRLYRNGIVMFEGPFRSYQEDSTQQCMQDLMDGYFPSELQDRYPDGVPFEVHDRREEEFIPRLPWGHFPGEGHAVQDRRDEAYPGKTLCTNHFLRRLPKVVVKAGRVIDVRDSGSPDTRISNSVILVDTPALQVIKDRLHTPTSDRPSGHNIITLKVKSEDGNSTYILKMCLSETVGHLRQHLDRFRGHDLAGYDIISAYPKRHYNDDCQTLGLCGLTTNVTLILRGRKTQM